jgi:hypothetical protein
MFYTVEEPKTQYNKATCKWCGDSNLVWKFHHATQKNILAHPDYYDEHKCDEQAIKPASCRHCKATDLVWIASSSRKKGKYYNINHFTLCESYGLPHACEQGKAFYLDYKEALRLNYKFEKKWIKSQKEGTCSKCKGLCGKWRKASRSSKHAGELCKWRKCKACKGVGTFTKDSSFYYLKQLRKQYWPWPWK